MSLKVVLHNEAHPEDNAMLQALYSRSAESVTDHIEKLKQVGSGKFMSQYYLGYGHASIADCGFITIYAEGVSMLAAKAIQDNPLYNGQESSSRYIDWSNQLFLNPYLFNGSVTDNNVFTLSSKLQTEYRNFYVSQKPVLIEHLKSIYPKKENEKDTVYEKAIVAKAFDILRGYLPCGAVTNVAWTTSLRKANEHLRYLALHPLSEVRMVAGKIHYELIQAYPSSIAPLPVYEEADEYLKDPVHYYSSGFDLMDATFEVKSEKEVNAFETFCPRDSVKPALKAFYAERPRREGLPKHDISLQQATDYTFLLDFGSYRDLQRHRGGYCSVPAIDNADGFHPWYFNQLPESSKKQALSLFSVIAEVVDLSTKKLKANAGPLNDTVDTLTAVKLNNQYLLPMGTLVNINLHYNVHQALYVAQLRSGQTVHATLRPVAQKMGQYLQNKLGIRADCDYSEDEWNTRRGTQDIVAKVV